MILSARYANPDNTAAVLTTDDNGDVAVEIGTDAWAEMLAWGEPDAFVPPPEPVPESISDRQFFQALALQEIITQAEALEAVKTGTIPPALRAFLDTLTGAEAFAAEMLLSGATEFKRSHSLTQEVGAAQGWTDAQIDDFWRFAAGL